LVLQSADGATRRVQLRGFTRGLAYDTNYFYVGESANRKAPTPESNSTIAVVDRGTLEVVHRFDVPFPEIYEIVLTDAGLTLAMTQSPERFQIGLSSERIREAEKKVEIMTLEIAGLRRRLENLQFLEQLHGTVVAWKRRLLG
jgi:hypothetical protein